MRPAAIPSAVRPQCPESHRGRLSHDSPTNLRLEAAGGVGQHGPDFTLPAPLQFIIAMIAYAINQRMARQLDYLHEEVRVLTEALAAATGKARVDLAPSSDACAPQKFGARPDAKG